MHLQLELGLWYYYYYYYYYDYYDYYDYNNYYYYYYYYLQLELGLWAERCHRGPLADGGGGDVHVLIERIDAAVEVVRRHDPAQAPPCHRVLAGELWMSSGLGSGLVSGQGQGQGEGSGWW